MTRWKSPLLLVGVALAAGSIGRWNGPIQPQTFAQESRQRVAPTPDDSTQADRGWIGVMIAVHVDGKLRIHDVFPGGPAAFAGIRRGDAILRVGDVKISTEEELAAAIEHLTPGEEAVVVVERNGKELPLHVHVGSLRDFHHRYTQEMWNRDPRDPNYAQSHGVSQADLSVELARRLFEQHERLETSLYELRQEVRALRRELQDKDKGKAGADR